jgi:hypothetical protein
MKCAAGLIDSVFPYKLSVDFPSTSASGTWSGFCYKELSIGISPNVIDRVSLHSPINAIDHRDWYNAACRARFGRSAAAHWSGRFEGIRPREVYGP